MVGDHDDQRVVVDALGPKASHQPAEQAVDEAELEQVALLVVASQELVVKAWRGVHPREQVPWPRSGARARGQIEIGPVGQQQVLHPQRGARGGTNRAKPALEARRPVAREVGDDGGLAREPALAHRGRAESRSLLGSDHAVALAGEHVEDRARVAATVRGGARTRAHAVEDERHGLGGRVVGRGPVAKPDGVAGQRGEVRIAHRVDAPAAAEQGIARELVEHEEHHVRRVRRRA